MFGSNHDVNISINTLSKTVGSKDAKASMKLLGNEFKNLTGLSLGYAGALTASIAVGKRLIDLTKQAVAQAKDAQLVTSKVNSVLASTKGIAGMTSESVRQLTDDLEAMTGVDGDLIASNAAVMLTFTKITDEVFPDAMEIALDMSEVLEKDLGSSVTLVSKLLNVQAGDVSQVSTAMSAGKKVGVSFTETQIEMAKKAIAAGDVLGYQKIILGELTTEYGGAAAAAGNTYAGSVNKLKLAVDKLSESYGNKLLPILTDINIVAAHVVNQTNELELKNKGLNETLLLLLTTSIYPLVKYYELLASGISKWAEKIRGTNGDISDLDTKIRDADKKYWEHRGYVEEVGSAYDSLGEKITPVTSYFQALTKEMIYNQIAAHLDEQGQLELARSMGLINENTYRALTAIDKLTESYDTNGNGLIDPIEKTNAFYAEIKKVTDTAGTYAWNFVVNSSSPGFNMAPGSIQEAMQQGLINGSAGGSSGGGEWVLKGTKGGAGTDKAWFNGSSWYYGDKPPERDSGGPGVAGGLYLINPKAGPEAFIPKTDGQFVPNFDKMMGGVTIMPGAIVISGAGDPKAIAREVMNEIMKERKLQMGGH
jgi:hypothetical protein